MKKFADYVALQEASFGQVPQSEQEPSWEQLRDFYNRHHGSFIRFKDWNGGTQIGKLSGLHDEGVFLVKTRDGQTHDVYMDMILGVQGMQNTPANRWEPEAAQIRAARRQ